MRLYLNRLSLALVLLLLSAYCRAQSFTAADLLKLSQCKYYDCVNDMMIAKGWAVNNTLNTGEWTGYSFTGKKLSTSTDLPDMLLVYLAKDSSDYKNNFMLQVSSARTYLAMKDVFLKTYGFKYVSTRNRTPGEHLSASVASTYQSAQYPGLLLEVTTNVYAGDGGRWRTYCFTLFQK